MVQFFICFLEYSKKLIHIFGKYRLASNDKMSVNTGNIKGILNQM